jgi:hypothetical protein
LKNYIWLIIINKRKLSEFEKTKTKKMLEENKSILSSTPTGSKDIPHMYVFLSPHGKKETTPVYFFVLFQSRLCERSMALEIHIILQSHREEIR